jgi:prolyl-tRNA editing enzyme YbaK/EbsC (Cys-tRNA(Pro) deacylase)
LRISASDGRLIVREVANVESGGTCRGAVVPCGVGGAVSAHPDVIAHLDRLGLVYDVMDCDPALADTAQFCAAYGVAPEESANAILVASKKPEGQYAVCVALAHTRLDVNGTVRRKLGVRKLSFAAAEVTRELTGQEIGGVTIFGLPDGLPVWLDARVLGCERIVVGAGSRSAKISLDPIQLAGIDGYEFVDDLAVEVSSASN